MAAVAFNYATQAGNHCGPEFPSLPEMSMSTRSIAFLGHPLSPTMWNCIGVMVFVASGLDRDLELDTVA